MRKLYIVFSVILFLVILLIVGFKNYIYFGECIEIKGTNTYHKDDCVFVKKSSMDKVAFIKKLEETAEKELRPCNSCNPPSNDKFVKEINQSKLQQIENNKVSPAEIAEIKAKQEKGEYITPRQKRILEESNKK